MDQLNQQVTLFASAVRNASVDGGDQTNYSFRGVILFFNISAVTDDDTFVLTLEGKDPVSGAYYTIFQSAALATTGLRVYEIHPQVAAAAGGVTAVANRLLPKTWRVTLTYGQIGGVVGDLTCSVAASMVK